MMRFTPPTSPAPVASPASRGRPCADVELPVPVTYVWSGTQRRLPRQLTEITLSSLAVVGVCCLLSVVLGLTLGVRPLLLRSGSMAPDLPVGTLAFASSVDSDSVEVGDVVSVQRGDERVTHRVVDTHSVAGVPELTLQGDANSAPDAAPVRATRVDRVFWSVPSLGTLTQRFGEPRSQFVVGVLSGGALLWAFGPAGSRRVGGWVPANDRRRRPTVRVGGSS